MVCDILVDKAAHFLRFVAIDYLMMFTSKTVHFQVVPVQYINNRINSFWGVNSDSEGIAQSFVQKRWLLSRFSKKQIPSWTLLQISFKLNAKMSFPYFVSKFGGGNFKENGYWTMSKIIGTFKKIHVVVKL